MRTSDSSFEYILHILHFVFARLLYKASGWSALRVSPLLRDSEEGHQPETSEIGPDRSLFCWQRDFTWLHGVHRALKIRTASDKCNFHLRRALHEAVWKALSPLSRALHSCHLACSSHIWILRSKEHTETTTLNYICKKNYTMRTLNCCPVIRWNSFHRLCKRMNKIRILNWTVLWWNLLLLWHRTDISPQDLCMSPLIFCAVL